LSHARYNLAFGSNIEIFISRDEIDEVGDEYTNEQ
jgi:hypothetical protein